MTVGENFPAVRFNYVLTTHAGLAIFPRSDGISCKRCDFFERANEMRRPDAFARTVQSGSFVAEI